jgi:hypothetical protein
MKRTLATLLTTTLLATGFIAGAAPATAATPTSFGVGICGPGWDGREFCDGEDPHATSCDEDRKMIGQPGDVGAYFGNRWVSYGTIQLRWSRACGTNWAHFTSNGPARNVVMAVNRTTGAAPDSTGSKGKLRYGWSPMLYGKGMCTRASVMVFDDAGKRIGMGYSREACG